MRDTSHQQREVVSTSHMLRCTEETEKGTCVGVS